MLWEQKEIQKPTLEAQPSPLSSASLKIDPILIHFMGMLLATLALLLPSGWAMFSSPFLHTPAAPALGIGQTNGSEVFR